MIFMSLLKMLMLLGPKIKNLNRGAELPKRVLKSQNTEYNFKWNQLCLSHGSNSQPLAGYFELEKFLLESLIAV